MTANNSDFKQVKVIVQMSAKTLFRYMMANTTFGIAGKIKWAVSIMALIFLPFSLFVDNNMISLGLLIIVSMYLIIQPGLLYASAKKQMIDNPIFKEPMIYTFDATGVALNQTIDSGMMPWTDLMTIRETRSMFLVYLQAGRALIVPTESMTNEDKVRLREIIRESGIKKPKLRN